jgi:DNA polymerase-3 subunit alpha
MLPDFPHTNGLSQDEYLYKLCVEGWNREIAPNIPKSDWPLYKARVKEELDIFKEAGISSYFNIVSEMMQWARERMLCGRARGSAGGCLISFLTRITRLDPIPPGLLISRFYNKGRNTPGKVSLPDIDNDFEIYKRHLVIEHMRELYGRDKVAQIATFNSLQGAAALSEVFRAWEVPFEEAKRITENIPDPARIAEELQEMRENGEEPSIIRYALENQAKDFQEWVVLNDDGTLEGEYAPYFAQAMRLEGTKKNISRHAAGLALSPVPLGDVVPMYYDENSGEYIACMEYTKMEALGIPKIDILGIAALDKMAGVAKLLRHGYINEDD